MNFSIQTTLENERAVLQPLKEEDFDMLYTIASDPAIWEQHPNKDRWKREVFEIFFEGALQSKGAFKIIDKASGKLAGSTRFYGYSEIERRIFIGYTFYARPHWGTGLNSSVKHLMLSYIFQYVDEVGFHVGSSNIRSQIAVERLGASKTGEEEIAYVGESPKLNFVYLIKKSESI